MVNPEGEVVGFIDIGTNSIHLLISRFDPEYGVTPIFQDKESVRMGRSLLMPRSELSSLSSMEPEPVTIAATSAFISFS